jgi:hypothetical protein
MIQQQTPEVNNDTLKTKTDRTGKHEFQKENLVFPKDKIIVKN